MKKLILALVTMSLVLVGNEARSAEGWIKVYVGDSERNQISASGSCTIILTPKSGDKKILKAELVTEGVVNRVTNAVLHSRFRSQEHQYCLAFKS